MNGYLAPSLSTDPASLERCEPTPQFHRNLADRRYSCYCFWRQKVNLVWCYQMCQSEWKAHAAVFFKGIVYRPTCVEIARMKLRLAYKKRQESVPKKGASVLMSWPKQRRTWPSK